MIVVRVELHSAITGKLTELARMRICNIGGTKTRGDYSVEVLRGRDKETLDAGTVLKAAEVLNHPRLSQHVWNLVAKALASAGYKNQ